MSPAKSPAKSPARKTPAPPRDRRTREELAEALRSAESSLTTVRAIAEKLREERSANLRQLDATAAERDALRAERDAALARANNAETLSKLAQSMERAHHDEVARLTRETTRLREGAVSALLALAERDDALREAASDRDRLARRVTRLEAIALGRDGGDPARPDGLGFKYPQPRADAGAAS